MRKELRVPAVVVTASTSTTSRNRIEWSAATEARGTRTGVKKGMSRGVEKEMTCVGLSLERCVLEAVTGWGSFGGLERFLGEWTGEVGWVR